MGLYPVDDCGAQPPLGLCSILDDTGAKVDQADLWLHTPLLFAARQGNRQRVALLLERDAEIAWKDIHGKSALSPGTAAGDTAVIEQLIEAQKVKHPPRFSVGESVQLFYDLRTGYHDWFGQIVELSMVPYSLKYYYSLDVKPPQFEEREADSEASTQASVRRYASEYSKANPTEPISLEPRSGLRFCEQALVPYQVP